MLPLFLTGELSIRAKRPIRVYDTGFPFFIKYQGTGRRFVLFFLLLCRIWNTGVYGFLFCLFLKNG
jgi:hypothetical protein